MYAQSNYVLIVVNCATTLLVQSFQSVLMSLKSLFNSLTGKTSSSNVDIIEKTHFTGTYFRKVIELEETLETKKKKALELDKMFPKSAPHEPTDLGYRFTFKVHLASGPGNVKLYQLLDASIHNRNYKAHTELDRHWRVKLLGPNDDGYRTNFIGYKLYDWLEIEPEYVRNGQQDDMWRGYIRAFAVSYHDISELHDGDSNTLLKETYVLEEKHVIY